MRGTPIAIILTGTLLGLAASSADAEPKDPPPGHGEAQFQAIVRDRPRMAPSLKTRPAVREWIIQRFNTTIPLIQWDPSPTVSGRKAEFDATHPDTTRVRVNRAGSGMDQLAALLFELHNIGHYPEFEDVYDRAVQGELSREEFAETMLGHEFEALLELRAFLEKHFDNLSDKERREARAYYRLRYGPDTMEKHVRAYLKNGFDLLQYYRDMYDHDVLAERDSLGIEP